MNTQTIHKTIAVVLGTAFNFVAIDARADAVTEWNARIDVIVTDARVPNHPATRAYAMAHTAAYEAVNAITRRYPSDGNRLEVAPGASINAAVAAANRATLTKLMPSQQAAIEAAYAEAIAKVDDGPAKQAGIEVGERAAAAVLAMRSNDGASNPEQYRPSTSPGVYVPTAIPAVPQWTQRKPWLMSSPAQFRPGPPPALGSAAWARDYNEVKELGGRNSIRRTAEQTEIARFWEASGPPIYHRIARSVAVASGRDVTRNARLFAALCQATDDAYIAVFDAKYHYGFWRPVTAIRNGDIDGNDATERDPGWLPLIDTPMHPEYPCAHCIIAATVATVLQADVGTDPMPVLTTTSPTAKNAARRWSSADDLVREVADARIHDGVHYRFSTEAGAAMGRRIGKLAAAAHLSK
jgi:hypothetical protein